MGFGTAYSAFFAYIEAVRTSLSFTAINDSFDVAGVAVIVHVDPDHVLASSTHLVRPLSDGYKIWKKEDPVFQYVQKKYFESNGLCAPIVVKSDVPAEVWGTQAAP